MTRKYLIYAFCTAVLLVGVQFAQAKPQKDILGLRVGMSKDSAVSRLEKLGRKDHDERKQQEIWTLRSDSHFSHIIVAYDKEYKNIRFVTAKMRDNGKRIRYSDVIDLDKAVSRNTVNNYHYTLEIPATGKRPAYKIIARGTDKEFLTYLAIEDIDQQQQ